MVRIIQILTLAVVFMHSAQSQAEYRIYELNLVNVDTGEERKVISTLDHYQYPRYHFVKARERVDYVTSWMCFGATNQRPACPNSNVNPQP